MSLDKSLRYVQDLHSHFWTDTSSTKNAKVIIKTQGITNNACDSYNILKWIFFAIYRKYTGWSFNRETVKIPRELTKQHVHVLIVPLFLRPSKTF